MEENFIKLRLEALCKALGISMRQFGISIGRSGSWVSSLSKIKTDAITTRDMSKILDIYPRANIGYLLTGNGSPLLDDVAPPQGQTSPMDEIVNYKDLCTAYRQDLAEAREEIRKLRDSYLDLMQQFNRLLVQFSVQTALSQDDSQRIPCANIAPDAPKTP